MAIKRVSDLEKYYFDESLNSKTLAEFLDSDEYKYSCIEISKNSNGPEHSQFQSMRMDICDLQAYLEYNVINNDIEFNGNKTFNGNVEINGSEFINNASTWNNTNTTAVVHATDLIELSTNMFKLSAANVALSTADKTNIRTADFELSANGNIQLSSNANTTICANKIFLDTPKIANTILSGKAEKILFDITPGDIDGKFAIKADNNMLLSVDKYNIFHFTKPINAIAMSAYWADLAEYYVADRQYKPGTLVKFGGKYEITVADSDANAIVTNAPGFILNSSIKTTESDQWPIAIALTGRTLVFVKGKVSKFQDLMLSDVPGVACISDGSKPTIGKALKDKYDDSTNLVECVVNLKL